MPIATSEERLDKKDQKEQQKIVKAQMKDYDLGKQIREEASGYGVNIDKPNIGPLSSDVKADIDKRVSQGVKDEYKQSLEKFQGLQTTPYTKEATPLNEDALKKSLKKQRGARWWDALYAMGEGLQGRTADPKNMRSKQLEAERKGQYQQYRDTVEKGKETLKSWEPGYVNKQLEYLESLKSGGSDLKQQKIQAEIDNIKARTKWQKNKPYSTSGSGKAPYPTYEYKTGEGQTIKIPMPGDQASAKQLNVSILKANQLKSERDRIQEEMDNALYQAKSEGWFGKSKEDVQNDIRMKYQEQLSKANADVKVAESKMTSFFEQETGVNTDQTKTTKSNSLSKEEYDKLTPQEQRDFMWNDGIIE